MGCNANSVSKLANIIRPSSRLAYIEKMAKRVGLDCPALIKVISLCVISIIKSHTSMSDCIFDIYCQSVKVQRHSCVK